MATNSGSALGANSTAKRFNPSHYLSLSNWGCSRVWTLGGGGHCAKPTMHGKPCQDWATARPSSSTGQSTEPSLYCTCGPPSIRNCTSTPPRSCAEPFGASRRHRRFQASHASNGVRTNEQIQTNKCTNTCTCMTGHAPHRARLLETMAQSAASTTSHRRPAATRMRKRHTTPRS